MGGGGGGAAIRSMAARFTAPSIVYGGFRKFPTTLMPPENLPFTEKGFLTGSVSASSTTEEMRTNVGSMIDSYEVVQKPFWDSDGGDEVLIRPKAAMPRIVFGGAPTIQEAKAATSDLKEALHKVYLSPITSTANEEEYMDVTSVRESVPENALKAFKLLDESPAIQSVVASIACDPNVWQAVQQNDALVKYLKFQKDNANNVGEIPDEQSWESDDVDEDTSGLEKSIEAAWDSFEDFLKRIKKKVMKMVSVVSDLQSLFEDSGARKTGEGSIKESDCMSLREGVMTSGLMGLAIMAILVVLTKRG